MDSIGWERRVRQLKDELARHAAEFNAYRVRTDRAAEDDARSARERQDDNWKLATANRLLRRQVEEAGLIPLA